MQRLKRLADIDCEIHKEKNWNPYPDTKKLEALEAERNQLLADKELVKAAREVYNW